MELTIYHNPKCSKSRATLEIINATETKPVIVEYLKNPPSKAALQEILQKLKITPDQLIRFKEAKAKELQISSKDDRSENEWLSLMVENPSLIERPIVVTSTQAIIGRPPENVLELL